jgi:hypothetical protein
MPARRKTQPSVRISVATLQDIPNIGPSIAGDLQLIGIRKPGDLPGRDPYQMYDSLCTATGVRHDPCVIDAFISAVRYMEGAPSRPWWKYTPERKKALAAARDRAMQAQLNIR